MTGTDNNTAKIILNDYLTILAYHYTNFFLQHYFSQYRMNFLVKIFKHPLPSTTVANVQDKIHQHNFCDLQWKSLAWEMETLVPFKLAF